MSSSLMRRAAKTIESKNKTISRSREARKQDAQDLAMMGGSAAGALAAAYVDSRWEEDDDGIASIEQLGGVPMNVAVGGGLVVLSAMGNRRKNRMARSAIGGAGLGMFNAGLYAVAVRKLEELED